MQVIERAVSKWCQCLFLAFVLEKGHFEHML